MSLPAVCELEQIPRSGTRVRIAYTDGCGEGSIRVIEPLRVYQGRNGHTYLRAWCHLREEERTFRMDRIRSWEQLGEGKGAETRTSWSMPQPDLPHQLVIQGSPQGLSPQACPPVPLAIVPVQAASPGTFAPRAVRRRNPLRTLFLLGLLFLAGRWLLVSGNFEDLLRGIYDAGSFRVMTVPAPVVPQATVPVPAAIAAKTPSQQAAAATVPSTTPPSPSPVQHLSYRGVAITGVPQGEGYLYRAEACGLSSSSRRGLHLKINSLLFRQSSGIDSPRLEKLYAGAHSDRDGYLSWQEIGDFQRRLALTYRYRSNGTALRPDEFLAQGGGDCEDWALLTCGLLRYWGWTGYVATFSPPGGGSGHALCMVRRLDLPWGFEYYTVEAGVYAWDGALVDPGYYLPIDYDVVGVTSNAVKSGWRLERFYTPERIYGCAM